MKFSTLLALTAGVSANSFQIDPFNIKNFMTADVMPNLIKSTKNTAAKLVRGESIVGDSTKVQWSQCDDDKGVFTLDTDSTNANPDPLQKGSDVGLNLVGVLSDAIDLDKVHIHVTWNGAPLYDQDAVGGHFEDSLEYTLSWAVPSYAPDGDYDVVLTGVEGSNKDFCVEAKFTF